MKKRSLGVIFGGASSEYEVSLMSSSSVLANIDREHNEVYPIGITKKGQMFLFEGDASQIKDGSWREGKCTPCVISPDRTHHGIILLENPLRILHLDCVFPVLHGKNGEDGTIQGLLTMAGIPFVGCGTLASAACMDKAVTHALLDNAGIMQARWISFRRCDYQRDSEEVLGRIEELGYPCFIKPANAGSSVGITKVLDRTALNQAVELALLHDDKVIAEEFISGIELECAVLGNEFPAASCVGEIAPEADFYDYNAKYIDGTTKTYAPARITEEASVRIRNTALKAYETMGCSGLARVDFFLQSDGTVILNEINTIPGFTSISMYPQLFIESGVPYADLIERLIEHGLDKWSSPKI